MITPAPKLRPDTGHVRLGDMADKRLPEGAFLPDGQPNIPSQAYADYLTEINPMMVPVADPEGSVARLGLEGVLKMHAQAKVWLR